MDKKQQLNKKPLLFLSRNREILVWNLLAFLVFLPVLLETIYWGGLYRETLSIFYNQILTSVFLIFFPFLFRLIFGQLPFSYIRYLLHSKHSINIVDSHAVSVVLNGDKHSSIESNNIESFINESKNIAEKIFSTSRAYLLVGCLIAFIGVAIFSSPLFPTTSSSDFIQRLLEYSPRFGALFFIESIAFFFLKQYRIMLEEYRYYEAIKRKRQDNFVLVELIEKYKDNPELLKILIDKVSQSTITKLANGETTEVLETQKIVNQEMDIFSKFIDLIKEIKSK